MAKKHPYTVPNMEAAHRLAEIARGALEAARARAPDQREHAARLFRGIYGPLPPHPPCNGDVANNGGG